MSILKLKDSLNAANNYLDDIETEMSELRDRITDLELELKDRELEKSCALDEVNDLKIDLENSNNTIIELQMQLDKKKNGEIW